MLRVFLREVVAREGLDVVQDPAIGEGDHAGEDIGPVIGVDVGDLEAEGDLWGRGAEGEDVELASARAFGVDLNQAHGVVIEGWEPVRLGEGRVVVEVVPDQVQHLLCEGVVRHFKIL
jgi:hypothetical protein